jgi:hypothetical protein
MGTAMVVNGDGRECDWAKGGHGREPYGDAKDFEFVR